MACVYIQKERGSSILVVRPTHWGPGICLCLSDEQRRSPRELYIDIVHTYHIIYITMGVLCCFVSTDDSNFPGFNASSTKRIRYAFPYIRPPSLRLHSCNPTPRGQRQVGHHKVRKLYLNGKILVRKNLRPKTREGSFEDDPCKYRTRGTEVLDARQGSIGHEAGKA